MKCWGYNSEGYLGDGTTTNRPAPVDVVGLSSGVGSIAVGAYHTCALLDSGDVKCWGANWDGQLADGTTDESDTPLAIPDAKDAIAISTSLESSCALFPTGGVKCWGSDWDGGLGVRSIGTKRWLLR